MRIALNARILQAPRTGIGQYVAALAQALWQQEPDLELACFHGWGWSEQLPAAALPGYSRWSALARQVPGAYQARRWLEQRRFDRRPEGQRPDLYHEPSLWPLAFDGPMVMTLHDLTHLRYPLTQPRQRLAEIHRRVDAGVAQARFVLTDSAYVADEVRRHYGLPAERVVVAPLGHAERFHPRTAEDLYAPLTELDLQPGGYLICVGTLEPRKNLGMALEAFARLPAGLRRRYPLLIAGMPGWRSAELGPALERSLASGEVRMLGYLPDELLAQVLAGAQALLFPSHYEGFGLPVLEAMASGVPVVLARSAALPEVAGEAGLYAEPDDVQGLSEALRGLLEDEREWLRRRALGLARAQGFSWQRCAAITAATYRQAAGS